MSKEKQEPESKKEFNILESSFNDNDILFTDDFKDTIITEPKEPVKEEPKSKDKAEPTKVDSKDPKVKDLEEPEETQEPKEKELDNPQEESSLKTFASWLGEKGIVDYEEDKFKDSEEGLMELVGSTIDREIQNYKNSLPEDVHKLVEFVEAGGNPKDFMSIYYNPNAWKDFEISDEKSQRFVLEEFMKAQASDDKGNVSQEDLEDIKETLDTYEVSGILEKKSKTALSKLKSLEKSQEEQLFEAQKKYANEQKLAAKKQFDDFKETLYKKEVIQGFKLTPKVKDDLWNFIMKPDKTGKTGLQKHNESNQDAQFLYAYLAMNDWDMEKLERQVKTKVNSDLANKLSNFKDGRTKIKGGQQDSFADQKSNGFSAFKRAIDAGTI